MNTKGYRQKDTRDRHKRDCDMQRAKQKEVTPRSSDWGNMVKTGRDRRRKAWTARHKEAQKG